MLILLFIVIYVEYIFKHSSPDKTKKYERGSLLLISKNGVQVYHWCINIGEASITSDVFEPLVN